MSPSQPDDKDSSTQNNVSLEEIKASAPRLDMDMDEPEDNCIICLQTVEDRTVLPSCAHDRMCFECIKKWTEQSRRCPLCNTPIGSHLIHRIRSEYDYQKHFLQPLRSSPPPQNIVVEARASYRARTRRPSEIEQDNLERAVEKRRWVYRHGLFAKHVASNPHTRFRPNPTPTQIASSPELQSRCQMFVRRELRVWPNLDIEFLTSFILSLAKSIDIRTESTVKLISEFLDINRRSSPSGGTVAEHFVHELYSYLRSPFRDLPAYDAVVQYDTPDDVEPPPPTVSRSNRLNTAGPSHRQGGYSPSPRRRDDSNSRGGNSYSRRDDSSRHRRYDLDDPLDASPRDADSESDMDMDEHWIEVPPNRRGGSTRREDSPDRRGGESRRGQRKHSSGRDGYESRRNRDTAEWDRGRHQDRDDRDYEESSRRGRAESRNRDERVDRRARSPTLGRSPAPNMDRSPSTREKEPYSSSKNRPSTSRKERSPEPRKDIDRSRRDREPRRHESRSPSPTRDRKGKRRADEYERRDRDLDRGQYGYRDGRSEDERGWKGKDRERHDVARGRRLEDGTKERGAEESGDTHHTRRGDGDEGMLREYDERGNNDAERGRDNDGQKGKFHGRKRWNDDDEREMASDSAAQLRDERGKAHRRRFSGSSRRYDASPSLDLAHPHEEYDQRPSPSSRHRPFTDDDDDQPSFGRSSHPSERTSYKSGQGASPHDLEVSTHVRQGSHESNRPSKRTRSPSPKSNREESGRDQKRPAVDHHSLDDSRPLDRSRSASSTWSANTRPHDAHGVDVRVNGATDGRRPSSITRGAQTRSRSPSRRPAHHNVQEPKTSEVERSSTAHHSAHTPFGLTTPGVDLTLSTQPEHNRDKTKPDTRDKTQLNTEDKTQLDTRDKSRTDARTRAPRLTPLASIRAHLQAGSRCSEPLSEDGAIKGSPTRSTMQLETSAINYPSAPGSASGPTLLPNAVERSSMALNDINTNPIHISSGSDVSNVSYSILGAAARSQVQPPLITASPDSTQRVCPNSTVGRNRLLLARLEAIRAATNSKIHASHLAAKSPASPTLPDTSGNQSATNNDHGDHKMLPSQNGQLGADPADVNTPAARFEVERRLKLQARLAARKREINAVMSVKEGTPL